MDKDQELERIKDLTDRLICMLGPLEAYFLERLGAVARNLDPGSLQVINTSAAMDAAQLAVKQ